METTETLATNDGAIAYQPTELEVLNLKVAAIAGWTDLELWQPERNLPIKTYQGVNLAHPELGRFVPNYVESIDAIAKVFDLLCFRWSIYSDGIAIAKGEGKEANAETPAIALCKLLLAINPEPIKPQAKAEIVEASFG